MKKINVPVEMDQDLARNFIESAGKVFRHMMEQKKIDLSDTTDFELGAIFTREMLRMGEQRCFETLRDIMWAADPDFDDFDKLHEVYERICDALTTNEETKVVDDKLPPWSIWRQ